VSAAALLVRPAGAQPENLLPDCTAAAPSVSELWPPNHKFVGLTIDGVTDPDGDPVAIVITGVAQDEPLAGAGDGDTCPDATGVGTDTASVRSERSGRGDGRVYHVSFSASDGRGGACTATVQVCVPHDRGQGSICGDQGPLVDSTAGAACEGDGCAPEDCAPAPDDVAPAECGDREVPDAVLRRVRRARELLGRMARLGGRGNARRLGLKAAKQLRKAAARAAALEEVSEPCAEALRARLERAGTCAACSAR
jgi:hypothetical protein